METLRRVQEELGASVILVGHDMGLMAQFVDRLGVMYAGDVWSRSAPSRTIFRAAAPVHPAADRQPAARSSGKASSGASLGLPPSLARQADGLRLSPALPARAWRSLLAVEDPAA